MEKQILFRLGEQFFSIPISDTDKIIRIEKYAIVPDVSSYIIGVQEVEGKVIPLVDLSKRFYQKSLEDTKQADVIVVNWKEERIGLVVDEVTAVKTVEKQEVKEKREQDTDIEGLSVTYIQAFFQTNQGIIPILNVHTLFSEKKADEIRQLLEIEGVKE